MDKTYIRKGKIKDQENDFEFWQTQSFYARLLTLEQIREEYNCWKYGTEQGLQRVYKIIKRTVGRPQDKADVSNLQKKIKKK